MRILRDIAELSSIEAPVVLAIGVFDGVHLGHRAVIERALSDAQEMSGTAVVVTFDPHPARVLRPDAAPRLLTSTQHKLRLIASLGVADLLVIHFDEAFASTSPDAFIRRLAQSAKALREICVGHQWSFGKARAGNLELLKALGDELGFEEVGVPAVEIDGEIVSSTVIRRSVEAGELKKAARYLGRDYTILGTVVEGAQLGRTLGFPTANLSAHNEQFPPSGVYAVRAEWRGKQLPGVANIGVRPTVSTEGRGRVLELHLFDFNQQIYGEDLEVCFCDFLRPEQKFAGLQELKQQISVDVQRARASLR